MVVLRTDFDAILKKIGNNGKYQYLNFFMLGLAGLHVGAHHMASVFTVGSPDHWCQVDGVSQNLTKDEYRSIAIPFVETKDRGWAYSHCERYNMSYDGYEDYVGTNMSMHDNETAVQSCPSVIYDYEVFGVTAVSKWGLVCDDSWRAPLLESIYMIGVLFGAIIFGSLSDSVGRKPTFLVAILLVVVMGFGSAFTPEYWSHMMFRCLQGFAAMGSFTCAFVLATEIIGARARMMYAILYQTFFAGGYMLLALISYLARDMDKILIIISLWPAIFLIYFWLVFESPRWLMTKGRRAQTEDVIKKVAKLNGKEYPADMVKEAFMEDIVATKAEKLCAYTIVDLLRTPNMRKKSLNIFFNWFVNSFVYFGLSLGVSDLGGLPHVNLFISGIMEILGCVVACLTLNRLGRRIPLAGLMVVGGVSCCLIAVVPREMALLKTVLAMIGKLGISGSFAVIYLFSAELFPTIVRTLGVGSGSMCARIGSLIAPFVGTLRTTVWGPLPYLIFGGSSIAAGLLALLLPETLKQPLPETLDDGENFGRIKHWRQSTIRRGAERRRPPPTTDAIPLEPAKVAEPELP